MIWLLGCNKLKFRQGMWMVGCSMYLEASVGSSLKNLNSFPVCSFTLKIVPHQTAHDFVVCDMIYRLILYSHDILGDYP